MPEPSDFERGYAKAIEDVATVLRLHFEANDLIGLHAGRRRLFLFVRPMAICAGAVETALRSVAVHLAKLRP